MRSTRPCKWRPKSCRGVPPIRFYRRLNQIFDQHDFDGYVEGFCRRLYGEEVGRPGLPPGRYFRLLPIVYFEGLDDVSGVSDSARAGVWLMRPDKAAAPETRLACAPQPE
jgi:hypothetical protein